MKKFQKLVINSLQSGTWCLLELSTGQLRHVTKREVLRSTTEELNVLRAQHLAGSDVEGEQESSSSVCLPWNKRKPYASAFVLGRFSGDTSVTLQDSQALAFLASL